jgi:hypothetical protein
MDEDQIQIMRERIAASKRKVGLSFDDARKTTRYSQDLLNQYRSGDSGASRVAAFRIDAYLAEPTNRPICESELSSIAEALRLRISHRALAKSDLRIGLALHSCGAFDQQDVTSLVESMKGTDDFSVASEGERLLPIIGTDFIQDYLSSTELFETGGMGGPQRPLIREMAEEALRTFNLPK